MTTDDHAGGMLHSPLPALDDPEGERVPEGLPPVVDAHVHLFPDALFSSIWHWFDAHGWPIRYRLRTSELVGFLTSRGVEHVVALHYAHRPGVARDLNQQMARLCDNGRSKHVTGTATVFPGEPDTTRILEEGFSLGLAGVKLHAHVQCFDLDGPEVEPIYACCAANDKPLVMHAGREPKSPAYSCDPHLLCGADKLERVLRRHPRLRICVPHLGADEFATYQRLLVDHDNLWLDTTMALADYLPGPAPPPLVEYRADRVIYGTDFPNIPYAWDRELKRICQLDLPEERLARLLWQNAAELFTLRLQG